MEIISHEKKSSTYFKNFTDLDFSYTGNFLWQMPVCLVDHAESILYSEQSTALLAWKNLNTMLLNNFVNLNSISNIFQETHDFLVLVTGNFLVFYFHLFKNHPQTFLWPGESQWWSLFFVKPQFWGQKHH